MSMKITTSVVMFYLWLTAAANLIEVTGVASAMGVDTGVHAGDRLHDAVSALGQVQGGGGAAESLLGVFNLISNSVWTFTSALSAGPRILSGLGIPIEIVIFLHAPVALFAARLGIYALSGREL